MVCRSPMEEVSCITTGFLAIYYLARGDRVKAVLLPYLTSTMQLCSLYGLGDSPAHSFAILLCHDGKHVPSS